MSALPHEPHEPPKTRKPLSLSPRTVDGLMRGFVNEVTEALGRGGAEEDQLRTPVKTLVQALGAAMGLPVVAYGEVRLPWLRARPDYGVDLTGIGQGPHSRVGYIEIKRPGHPIPPSAMSGKRDREQWEKFQNLTNILYTNGTQWSLFQNGHHRGTATTPDFVRRIRKAPTVDPVFSRIIEDFLCWTPDPAPGLDRLITLVAHLCAQLRDEVADILAAERYRGRDQQFTRLSEEWRDLLFPNLETDRDFPDVYAQAVTFSLILAREAGVGFRGRPLHEIGELLGKHHRFLSKAFGLLTEFSRQEEQEERNPSILATLVRVLEPVDWSAMMREHPRAHVDLYETFLARYDPELRRRSGAYFTPAAVADYMAGFTDAVLRTRMGLPLGLAEPSVTTLDPAMGSGTFLSSVMDRAAATLTDEYGEIHGRTWLKDMYRGRLIGFERSTAAFAVSELRLHQQLREGYGAEVPEEHSRFLCNTLDDPDHHFQIFGRRYDELVAFREQANRIKRTTPVMVVLGNPPYIERARQRDPAPWLERRRAATGDPVRARPSMDEFREPGSERLAFKLSSASLYFWRWATWKVFDAHPDQPCGVVAFVSTSAYLTSESFAGMRRYLRQTADEGWIVDLSPEGHRSSVGSRIFGGVQQPVCIGIFARYGPARPDTPARVWHCSVQGDQADKFAALARDAGLHLDGEKWTECPRGWTAPFAPEKHEWLRFPVLADLMPWQSSGVGPNRTWVIAPDQETLRNRWERLASAPAAEQDGLFKATRDRDTTRRFPGLPTIAEDRVPPRITSHPYRAFDQQYIVDDTRYVDFQRTSLQAAQSDRQIHVVEQHAHAISGGPGLLFTALPPNVHYFNGRGGRALPLYRTPDASSPNLAPRLLDHLSARLGQRVSPEDVVAYLAAIAAHPGYTAAFAEELETPGIRIPLTATPGLWDEAVGLGRQVVWLHTYGTRLHDPAADRPARFPRLPPGRRPQVLVEIPDGRGHLPDMIRHDSDEGSDSRRLHVGEGVIAPVEAAAWNYRVGGMHVIGKWFTARRRNPRHVRRGSALDDIRPERWTPAFTDGLLRLVAVLTRLTDLEPAQADLLERVRSSPLITTDELTEARVLPVRREARKAPPRHGQGELPLL
ncbi:N-6 DNA methylase [Nocardiopsis sp. MT53]|uniref:site-specific DNA-methyltransferase (adenine-specific) n=2 Tax=Nocardiopsidaceae TaxID=83676 RepID=A0ABX8BS41_9ACTN|nr:N-6 DNA methylase [Nocardiopsis changdeensis]QYX35295.1 N-6 DNA methylase [Nocardiopsis sp. MT53]